LELLAVSPKVRARRSPVCAARDFAQARGHAERRPEWTEQHLSDFSLKDLTVAFLEKTPSQVLTPVEYVIEESELKKRKYRIYDYDLKSVNYNAVNFRCPAANHSARVSIDHNTLLHISSASTPG
jgi:hypothetical protein